MNYCERLCISPPSVDQLAARGETKLFHLLVATLLENGAPMGLDQVIERLQRAGVQSRKGPLSTSLKRSWRGRRPVYRVDDDRVGLDVCSPELHRIVGVLESTACRGGRGQLEFGLSAVGASLPYLEEHSPLREERSPLPGERSPVPRRPRSEAQDGPERRAGAGGRGEVPPVRAVVDALLSGACREDDMADLVDNCPPVELRRALVDLCRERAAEGRVRSLVTEGFDRLGLGESAEDLGQVVLDRQSSIDARSLAAQVLGRCDAPAAARVQRNLSPVDAMGLVRADIAELGLATLVEAENAFAVGEVLRAAPADRAMEFAAICGQARRDAGVPAATMYQAAIRQTGRADLREAFLRAVVDEGGLAGERLLEELLLEAQDPQAKRSLRGALMRSRTRTAELIGAAGAQGQGWISGCDGQGAYWVLALIETPRSGPTLIQACVRAGRDLREIVVAPRATEDEVQSVMAQLAEMATVQFVEAPLTEVARSVVRAARRNDGRDGRMDLSLEMLGAAAVFERAAPGVSLDPAELELPRAAGGKLAPGRVRRLLSRPEYLDSWFFAEDDLSATAWENLGALSKCRPDEVLHAETLQPRLVAMAEHMARFHELQGDLGAAALAVRLARETERTMDNVLVRTMLAETDARLGALAPGLIDLAGLEGGVGGALNPTARSESVAARRGGA